MKNRSTYARPSKMSQNMFPGKTCQVIVIWLHRMNICPCTKRIIVNAVTAVSITTKHIMITLAYWMLMLPFRDWHKVM